ncbi:MAG: low specificity L-threonine aldolase, partial [Clostridia bacterium]|nr:low specificity L-threonine aldolase [Clostridia bacterium]
LDELGIPEVVPSPTNQVFPVLTNEEAAALAEEVVYTFWEKADEGHSVIRLCTSWATTDEGTDALIAVLRRVLGGR